MNDMKHKILKMEKLLTNLMKMKELIENKEIEMLDNYFHQNQRIMAEITVINEQLLVSTEKVCMVDEEKIKDMKQAILIQNEKNIDQLKQLKTVTQKDLKVMNQKVAASVAYNNMKRLNY